MKVIVFGATGTAGSEVVRQAIADVDIERVIAISRQPMDIDHLKVKVIVHRDFLDYKELFPVFQEADACIWCLGISQNKVTKEQYYAITYEYVMAAARAMLSVNPGIAFVFLSGQGADSSEKSRILFARVKGKAENSLQLLPFRQLYLFRPAGIIPVYQPENSSFLKNIKFKILKTIAKLLPRMTVTSVLLAKAMFVLLKSGNEFSLLENRNIKEVVHRSINPK